MNRLRREPGPYEPITDVRQRIWKALGRAGNVEKTIEVFISDINRLLNHVDGLEELRGKWIEEQKHGSHLIGQRAIEEYAEVGWASITEWIDTEGFPARKFNGVWRSDKKLIRDWFVLRISENSVKSKIGVVAPQKTT